MTGSSGVRCTRNSDAVAAEEVVGELDGVAWPSWAVRSRRRAGVPISTSSSGGVVASARTACRRSCTETGGRCVVLAEHGGTSDPVSDRSSRPGTRAGEPRGSEGDEGARGWQTDPDQPRRSARVARGRAPATSRSGTVGPQDQAGAARRVSWSVRPVRWVRSTSMRGSATKSAAGRPAMRTISPSASGRRAPGAESSGDAEPLGEARARPGSRSPRARRGRCRCCSHCAICAWAGSSAPVDDEGGQQPSVHGCRPPS